MAFLVMGCIWVSARGGIRRIGMLAVPGGQPGWGRHVQGRARYHGDDGGPPRNVGRLHPAADTTFNNLPKLGGIKASGLRPNRPRVTEPVYTSSGSACNHHHLCSAEEA
jgi:hypothetical protein